MTCIDTTRTHRPIHTSHRFRRPDRAAEAVILAAGIVFGGLLVSAHDAYAADPQNLQLAAAPAASMLSTVPANTGGLDLSMPETSVASSDASAAAYDRHDGARMTALDDRTRLHGVHRLEIDLYGDDMRPQGGTPLR